MKITALVENTTSVESLVSRHGLSIYVETPKHKVLFDVGPDDTFLGNAKKLGIDIAEVDTVVLSHGHKDHGGGLASFLKANDKARIYINSKAFEPHYIKVLFAKISVGIDPALEGNSRVVFVDDNMCIDDELFIFSDVAGQFSTQGNRKLLKKSREGYTLDDFTHEQNLLVSSEGKVALLTGCSHRGIVNIMSRALKYDPQINVVVGGFHLYDPSSFKTESRAVIEGVARELEYLGPKYYTCHCTGTKAFQLMHSILGEKVSYLGTGKSVQF